MNVRKHETDEVRNGWKQRGEKRRGAEMRDERGIVKERRVRKGKESMKKERRERRTERSMRDTETIWCLQASTFSTDCLF